MIRRYETERSVRWYLLETSRFGVQLVKLKRASDAEGLHPHPWDYVDVVLLGGYTETRAYHGLHANVPVKWFTRKRSRDEHRLVRLHRDPTWVLRLHGQRVRRTVAHA